MKMSFLVAIEFASSLKLERKKILSEYFIMVLKIGEEDCFSIWASVPTFGLAFIIYIMNGHAHCLHIKHSEICYSNRQDFFLFKIIKRVVYFKPGDSQFLAVL